MKWTKLLAAAIFASFTLTVASHANAQRARGAAGSAGRAGAARSAAMGRHGGSSLGRRAGLRNGRYYPYYPYGYGYPPYIGVLEDGDTWSDQWASLYEDNDGPYAQSTRPRQTGPSRIWEICDENGCKEKK
jgi:hypothetical protein